MATEAMVPVKKDPRAEFNTFLTKAGIPKETAERLTKQINTMQPKTQKIFMETLNQMKTAGMKTNAENIKTWIHVVDESTRVVIGGAMGNFIIETEGKKDYNLMLEVCQKLTAFSKERAGEWNRETDKERGLERAATKFFGQYAHFFSVIKMTASEEDAENYVDFQYMRKR